MGGRPTLTERITTRLVTVIRHPLFVAAYTIGTAYWWAAHAPPGGWAAAFRDDVYPWPMWTALASILALWVESSVGISQYHQQRRDAAMMARLVQLGERVDAQTANLVAQNIAIEEVLRQVARVATALLIADEESGPAEQSTRGMIHRITKEFLGFRHVAEAEYGRRRQSTARIDKRLAWLSGEVARIEAHLGVGEDEGGSRRAGRPDGEPGADAPGDALR